MRHRALRSRTVLVIEDDPDLLELLAIVLRDGGYQVRTAKNGQEGLDAVAGEMPGLILLDMLMPVMNGWEFAHHFGERFDSGSPIVVVTAAENARQRAAEVGASGWLAKPFALDALVDTVRAHLGE